MIRKLAADFLPRRFLQKIKPALERSPLFMSMTEVRPWQDAVRGLARHTPAATPERVLVLSCDPWTLVGSRGDEAMTRAVIERVRLVNPNAELAIVTASQEASAAALMLGAVPLEQWKRPFSYGDIASALEKFRPDVALVIGADVLDGHYSPAFSARLLLAADLCARFGARTALLGFSFNTPNAASMKTVLGQLSDDLTVNIRDAVSLERFLSFSERKARLTADVAFLLPPTVDAAGIGETSRWIDRMRAKQKVVVGLNIHPLLFRSSRAPNIEDVVDVIKDELKSVLETDGLALLLVSHDVREGVGDQVLLEPILAALKGSGAQDFEMSPVELTASEVKELVGKLDCVLTARMHLAIAAFGQGVPVAAITYQGKFQGLFRHFDMGMAHAISPSEMLKPGRLREAIQALVRERHELRDQVLKALPLVKAHSERNVSVLAEKDSHEDA